MEPSPIYQATPPVKIPSYNQSNYSRQGVTNYIQSLMNQGSYLSSANSYTHGATVSNSGYGGSVYSPTQNRIYLVPSAQSGSANWHYIDCNTGTVVAYPKVVATVTSDAYLGGAYSPTQNRIYFAPSNQADPANAKWHYIDCNTGLVGEYDKPTNAIQYSYYGAVYSPIQNRIYFVPDASNSTWHYIDCNTGAVVNYSPPVFNNSYVGGVYSPTQNRIYFVPNSTPNINWQYIDCNDGSVGSYPKPTSGLTSGNSYAGGAYSPTQNRIYFVPFDQADPTNSTWHYIDCNDGSIGTYPNPGTVTQGGYRGAIYSPTQNRIYFSPRTQGLNIYPLWHYIDCNTGLVGTYPNPLNSVTNAYIGGSYSPTQNRIYFCPRGTNSVWHFLDMQSNAHVSKVFMASTEYNSN